VPTYEFKCDECGADFEVTAHIAQRDEKAVCPQCGGRAVHTVFGKIAVRRAASRGTSSDLLRRGLGSAALSAPKP
jgi:putative FmdB family regulatory protein